jgi:hypothetical protein
LVGCFPLHDVSRDISVVVMDRFNTVGLGKVEERRRSAAIEADPKDALCLCGSRRLAWLVRPKSILRTRRVKPRPVSGMRRE